MSAQRNFSNFSKDQKSERPSFGKTGGKFGERMGMSSRNSNQEGEKRGFSFGSKPQSGFGNKDNKYSGNKRSHDNEEQPTKLQRGSEWYDSSDFCRTNSKTGEIKWKEEFWTNKAPAVHMYEPKRDDGRGVGFYVPSNWKFQNGVAGKYESSDGKSFMYEFTRDMYEKGCKESSNYRPPQWTSSTPPANVVPKSQVSSYKK